MTYKNIVNKWRDHKEMVIVEDGLFPIEEEEKEHRDETGSTQANRMF